VIQFYESTEESHTLNNAFIKKVRAHLIGKADFVLTIGSASTRAVQAMGIDVERILTLFNPVDVAWFYEKSQIHCSSETKGHNYLHVGQLIERKNVAVIIESFASIKNTEDTLTIVGIGPLHDELIELSASLGILDSVFFAGHLEQVELAKVYTERNTLVLASTNEVWGLVVNEALACGMHVVVSDKCGVTEFVQDMRGVFLCPPDKFGVASAMKKSRAEWKGKISNPQVLEYTQQAFADQLMNLVKEMNISS
jgi:glycosyltransferase involved in cell wall biosynthesis